jgi:hypothetical protein
MLCAMKPDRALLLRAVRFARLPGHGHTVPETCARFGITRADWRKAQRELAAEARLVSDEDYILAGLHPSGPVTVASLIQYYDWVNHAGITAPQVRAILNRLIKQGWVRRVGDAYALAREWP